ncbi:MAG TPA: ectonucleotide pyrophosphatase/phosphodiesterase [Bacteroidota bacterium]|nr:ectonucleotide pyrophosphatase/phosphodiesterase [Bacteroidota bacterium]
MKRTSTQKWIYGIFALVGFCGSVASQPKPITDLKPTVLLISIDGFRYDYFEKTDTPNFGRLMQNGVKAKWMISQFPTKTFPNHYTVVTGLRPANHGIVANTMFDPEFNEGFSLRNLQAIRDGKWWGGEPLWSTAEKQGQISATYFWPGSEAEIAGKRPSYWKEYNHSAPDSQRISEILAWLELPVERRPTFLTLYFATIDDAGHKWGPESDSIKLAIRAIDKVIGYLLTELEARTILSKINIIIISDHGMSQTSSKRMIFIDDYVDSTLVRIIDWSPVAQLLPHPGKEDEVYRKLANAHPNLKVYRKSEIPERWHYRNHRRIMPIIAVADDGWTITSRRSSRRWESGGDHGYDNELESMRAIFLAHGPAFRSGIEVDPFENIHIYNLVCEILKLNPALNDGDQWLAKMLLK